ncbi:MAG: hypothetical protein ACYCOU_19150, partial [Sulfobacillus sp.]
WLESSTTNSSNWPKGVMREAYSKHSLSRQRQCQDLHQGQTPLGTPFLYHRSPEGGRRASSP